MNSPAAQLRAILLIAGQQPHLTITETTLRMPDGRAFVLPLEIREDGLYCQLNDEARDAIAEYAIAPKSATLPSYPIANLADRETGDLTEFLMNAAEISRFALRAPPPLNLNLWREPARRPSKGAQRRREKPWHCGNRRKNKRRVQYDR